MISSLSNPVNNLAEGIHTTKCKYWHDNKECETRAIKYKDCECFLEYTKNKNNLKWYKCSCCNKNCQKNFDKNFKKRFASIYRFANRDINKFILLLREGVYPYENKNDWEKINGTSLAEKEDFYSHLNIKDISNAHYTQAKRAFKNLKITDLGEYHALYVQSNTLFLADVFENFRNTCLEIYKLNRACFLNVPGLAGWAVLKKTN